MDHRMALLRRTVEISRPGLRPTGPLIPSMSSNTSLPCISEICESTNSDYSVVLVFGFSLGFLQDHLGKKVIGFCDGALLIFDQLCWLVPSVWSPGSFHFSVQFCVKIPSLGNTCWFTLLHNKFHSFYGWDTQLQGKKAGGIAFTSDSNAT